MKRLLLAVSALVLVLAAVLPTRAAAPRKVLFFTKSSGFQHSVITRKDDQPGHAEVQLAELGAANGFEVTCTKDGSVFTKEGLAPYDVVALYTTGNLFQAGTDGTPPWPEGGRDALLEFINQGKGFVGFHCATDTMHSGKEVDPYIRMIGAEFVTHGAQQKATQKLVTTDFPGLEGVDPQYEMFEEWYAFNHYAADDQVIYLQSTEGMTGPMYEGKPAFPSTWIRQQGQGRVFYTSMGHREDVWTSPIFRKVALAGLNWAAGNSTYTVKPNIAQVAPEVPMAPGA